MLKIRLQRTGRTNMPTFRIIVVEHARAAKTGKFVERVGTYNPKTKERNINGERVKYWLSVGAKASPTMHNMLISSGIIKGKKINVLPKKSPPKKQETEPKSAPAPESAETTTVMKEVPAPELNYDVKQAMATVAAE